MSDKLYNSDIPPVTQESEEKETIESEKIDESLTPTENQKEEPELTEFEKEKQDKATRRARWRKKRKKKPEVVRLPLEKGDLLAMFIAAFITFGPVLLILILIMLFVGRLFM